MPIPISLEQAGQKRYCPTCRLACYDLTRDPIICPSCGSEYDPDSAGRFRKNRTVAPRPDEAVASETSDDIDIDLDTIEETENPLAEEELTSDDIQKPDEKTGTIVADTNSI